MLNANEAYIIARDANMSDVELKEIEHDIDNKAMNGEYSVTLFPSSQYHPRTLKKLEQLGYKVTFIIDKKQQYYCYNIGWWNSVEE